MIVGEYEKTNMPDSITDVEFMKERGYATLIGITYDLKKIDRAHWHVSAGDIRFIEEKITPLPNVRCAYLNGHRIKTLWCNREDSLLFLESFNRWIINHIEEIDLPCKHKDKLRRYGFNSFYGNFCSWPLSTKKNCVWQYLLNL